MKIEFRKITSQPKPFKAEINSVSLEGNFCRISRDLVKVDAILNGCIDVECCRCGVRFQVNFCDNLKLIISEGVAKIEPHSDEFLIEINTDSIDFHDIIQSEIDSISTDYHICELCLNSNKESFFEF